MATILGTCQTIGCGKAATLQCPKCKQLNLPASYFCSQECFKDFWSIHKLMHDSNYSPPEKSDKFKGFHFTGPVSMSNYCKRPGKISPRRPVPAHINKPDYAETGNPISEMKNRNSHTVEVLSAADIAAMREVCKIGREILDIAGAAIKVGMTTDEIDRIVHEATIARNAYPSPLNYKEYPKSCCTSVNEIICHGIPDSRPLEDGDIVNVDISAYYNGFHTDLNEMFLVGNVDEAGKLLVQTTYDALEAAIAIVKPGVMYREIGDVISRVVHKKGFSVVKAYCGHGVGRLFHSAPNVPHYARNKAVGVIKAGHVFTIEPMINEGVWQDKLWPDDWTSATADGKRSAQFEHTILVTETGCEVLTKRTKVVMLDAAKRWVAEKGWNVDDYEYKMSSVQSCPEGQCCVDVYKKPEDDLDAREQIRLSRVLEIDLLSGKVENVLAGRDPQALSKLLELEKIYSTTNALEEELVAQEQKRKAAQDNDNNNL